MTGGTGRPGGGFLQSRWCRWPRGAGVAGGAAARVAIIAFTGSDTFRAKVTIKAGTSLFEPRTATRPGTPAQDVVLSWNTFLDAATQAGMSRRLGGIHFASADGHGRANGSSVGYFVYEKAATYWNGTATATT